MLCRSFWKIAIQFPVKNHLISGRIASTNSWTNHIGMPSVKSVVIREGLGEMHHYNCVLYVTIIEDFKKISGKSQKAKVLTKRLNLHSCF